MSVLRRVESLERAIRFRRPRWIVVAVDGTKDDDGGALDVLLKELDVQDDETVVCVKRFVEVAGLPCIVSVS